MDAVESLESNINRSDYKVLIVDDVVSNVLLLKILLTNEKFQVCTANNGTSCIDMARKEHPDLILMDIRMPDMNGLDATRIIKEVNHEIPIVALSAYAFEENIRNAKEAGCDDFMAKPFKVENLIEIVKKYLGEDY